MDSFDLLSFLCLMLLLLVEIEDVSLQRSRLSDLVSFGHHQVLSYSLLVAKKIATKQVRTAPPDPDTPYISSLPSSPARRFYSGIGLAVTEGREVRIVRRLRWIKADVVDVERDNDLVLIIALAFLQIFDESIEIKLVELVASAQFEERLGLVHEVGDEIILVFMSTFVEVVNEELFNDVESVGLDSLLFVFLLKQHTRMRDSR